MLHDGRLYVVNDNEEQSYLAAYDARSGRERWRVNGERAHQYSTPLIWENELRTGNRHDRHGARPVRRLSGRPLWDILRLSALDRAVAAGASWAAVRERRLHPGSAQAGVR